MKYNVAIENDDGWCDWVQPQRKGFRMRCCDCGLVHSMDFRMKKGYVQFRASRDARATGQVRRWMSKK